MRSITLLPLVRDCLEPDAEPPGIVEDGGQNQEYLIILYQYTILGKVMSEIAPLWSLDKL